MKKPFTTGQWLDFAVAQFEKADLFFGHGTDNAWDEAVALVLHVLQLPHSVSRDVLATTPTPTQQQQIRELILQRVTTRKPLPYLTHEAYFAGLPFYVDERVLIPRSPIAELIQTQFTPWVQPDHVHHILDLCTGSACIAIACAKAFPHAQVDASDIDENCLAVAQYNIEKHQVMQQVHLIQSDLFQQIPHQRYDVIVSNPPYVDKADMDTLPAEYLHEPSTALFGGQDGLDFVKHLLQQAKHYLTPQGILVVEVGNSETALAAQWPQMPFLWLSFEEDDGGVFLLTADQL